MTVTTLSRAAKIAACALMLAASAPPAANAASQAWECPVDRVCGWEVWEAEGLKTIETPALAPGQCRNLPGTRTAANRTGTSHILWGGFNCTGREYPLLVGAYASAAAGALSISAY